jgi:cytidylate kinase
VYIEKLSGFLILDPRKLVIAIDGPAASGKSTTAKLVARKLAYLHVDTGAMYRAVTVKVLRAGLALDDQRGIGKLMESTHVELRGVDGELQVLLDGEDVSDEIRSVTVTRAVSAVSSMRKVRQAMVREQRALGRDGGIVLEGRDIGTVVFPDADLKFFMVAGIEARAHRRRLDLAADGVDADLGTLMREIEERDRKDSSRRESPLRKAEDAVEIDTSSLTIEEQVDMVVRIVREKLGQTGER